MVKHAVRVVPSGDCVVMIAGLRSRPQKCHEG